VLFYKIIVGWFLVAVG